MTEKQYNFLKTLQMHSNIGGKLAELKIDKDVSPIKKARALWAHLTEDEQQQLAYDILNPKCSNILPWDEIEKSDYRDIFQYFFIDN